MTFKEWLKYNFKGQCIYCKSSTLLNDNKVCMDCQKIIDSDL